MDAQKIQYDRGLLAIIFLIKQLQYKNAISTETMEVMIRVACAIHKIPLNEQTINDIFESEEMLRYNEEMTKLHEN